MNVKSYGKLHDKEGVDEMVGEDAGCPWYLLRKGTFSWNRWQSVYVLWSKLNVRYTYCSPVNTNLPPMRAAFATEEHSTMSCMCLKFDK